MHVQTDGYSLDSAGTEDIGARLRTQIRAIGIPPRPAVLDRIRTEMHGPEPDVRRLAAVICADVGIAASVVKVANSPFYGFDKTVRSVPEALLVLGLRVTLHMVAGLALQQTFPNVPNLERFWLSAARTARVTGWLALTLKKRTRVRPDDAYTYALFRDCGIPLLLMPFPEYVDILKQAGNEGILPFTDVEDRELSINHALIGAELAEDWLLPSELFGAIRYHHDVAAIEGRNPALPMIESRHLIALAQIAEELIHLCTGLDHTEEWTKLGPACLQTLGIDGEKMTHLQEACREVVNSDE